MLKVKMDNPDLENSLRQTFGDDAQSLAQAFADFAEQRSVRQDIKISINQLDKGDAIGLKEVNGEIRIKYE